MSCPYTSPQNGKVECMVRTTNNIVRTLLFQASMPPQYWVKSLHTITHLLNRLPTKNITASCPYIALYNTLSTYEHLRVFRCAYYPNMSATAPHKLASCPTWCAFIGYSTDHKGYRCLDLSTNRIVIFRHVVFDEGCFPFVTSPPLTNDYEFLSPIETRLNAGTPVTLTADLTVPPSGPTTCPTDPPPPDSLWWSTHPCCRGKRSDHATRRSDHPCCRDR
jgi:hypothetical protein